MAHEKECRLFLCKRGTLIAVGIAFELGLVLTMIFPYAAQYETWRLQRSPSITEKYQFEGPSVGVVLGHWLCFAFAFIFGLTFFFVRCKLCAFIAMMSLLPQFVIVYIVYLVLFFGSDEFVWFGSYMSLDQANALLMAARSTRPELWIQGTGDIISSDLVSGSKSCHTKRVPLEVTYDVDVSPAFEVTQNEMKQLTAWRLKIDATAVFINESEENMKEIYANGKWCVPSDWFYRNVVSLVSIPGLPEEIIVTQDGKPLPCIGKFHAVMSGIFLHGLSYAYRVALIPSVTVEMKKQVMFKPYDVSNICDDLGECK